MQPAQVIQTDYTAAYVAPGRHAGHRAALPFFSFHAQTVQRPSAPSRSYLARFSSSAVR